MFGLAYGEGRVLPTLGTRELFQSKRLGEGLLGEALLGKHRGHAIGPLVAEWRVEKDELLNLSEFLQEAL